MPRIRAMPAADSAAYHRCKRLSAAAAQAAAAAVAASPRPRPIWQATAAERAEHHAICQEILALLGRSRSRPRYRG
jgi:hypothetical protein